MSEQKYKYKIKGVEPLAYKGTRYDIYVRHRGLFGYRWKFVDYAVSREHIKTTIRLYEENLEPNDDPDIGKTWHINSADDKLTE